MSTLNAMEPALVIRCGEVDRPRYLGGQQPQPSTSPSPKLLKILNLDTSRLYTMSYKGGF